MTDLQRTAPRLLLDERSPMRDGVELSNDIYLPPDGDGPWPTILQRTPYDNTIGGSGDPWPELAAYFALCGYAFVSQDVRGRADSDGDWVPFLNEGPDGYDTIEWIAGQRWSTGRIGMMGGSYGGLVQWLAAKERPPHLTALVSTAAAGRWFEEIPAQFGVYKPQWAIGWLNTVGGRTHQVPRGGFSELPDWDRIRRHRPARDMDIALGRTNTVWRTWLEHDTFDDYWRPLSLDECFASIDLPILHITGWFDGDQWGELYYWHGMMKESPAADRQWLLVGPWDHAGTRVPERRLRYLDFGQTALVDIRQEHLRFFDRWLKDRDTGQEKDPKVRYFVMSRNEWKEAAGWPIPGTRQTPLYFSSGGQANSGAGDGRLGWSAPEGEEEPDHYKYDPDDPTPSDLDYLTGPHILPSDNRWRLLRSDTLVYTSDPVEEELEVTGHLFVVLFAASDCVDTDWHVTVADVQPNGRSDELTHGCMRAAFRKGRDVPPTPIEPGRVYEYRLELMAISNLWKQGHRIRVTVASASFPSTARNPNTNARAGDDDVWQIAHNTVHHSASYPSHLLLPVIGGTD